MYSSNATRRDVASRQNPKPNPQSTVPSKRSAEAQEAAWVADEDRFVLQQAKRKASIRVRAGRAQPIDLLAVTLQAIDPLQAAADEDGEGSELQVVDPEGVFEGLDEVGLAELQRGIDTYLALEKSRSSLDFWNTMKIICEDRRQALKRNAPTARGINSVSSDLDRLLGSKNYEELEALEKQIRQKLRSDEPIDFDYWDSLLKNLLIYKAKAKLRKVSQSVIKARLDSLRKQQEQEAATVQHRIMATLRASGTTQDEPKEDGSAAGGKAADSSLDPEPALKLIQERKALNIVDEADFLNQVTQERRRVLKTRFVPMPQNRLESGAQESNSAVARLPAGQHANNARQDESSALYEREAARGVGEDEEVFTGEEEVTTISKSQWSEKYRPRKPRYFNRVQMGYEWNKYNQTHYDHDNPPPKVVQGYKFNIFYPDLIDRTKAPTYRIERENGRKRGQSFAPAGEEDTCLIRFIAGPPYEDIAFRIVDKEWDYSAKRERGFKSSFDKERRLSLFHRVDMLHFQGILQLHFQFKKIYYRK